MSQKSKQQLLLDNQTNFPNNNNGFITPDKLRNFHVDLIDSTPAKSDVDLIQSEVDSLESVLSSEISRALSAENSLSTAIEQSGGDLIQQEISDRISGDISLTNKINVETSQRTSTDISLTNKINVETSDRIEKDIELGSEVSRIQGLIIGEVESRILVDGTLSTAILTETSQRISGDLSLVNKLSSDYVPYLNANKDLDMGVYTIKGSGLKLNTSNPYIVYNTGDMGWNSTEGTIDLRLLNNTTLQIGQEVYVYAKAIELIENGSVVQYAGVQGDHILVKKARPSEINLNSSLIVGVATQNINANDFGYITAFGKINDVYTTGFNLSDTLYLDMSDVNIYGRLTNIEPSVGNVKVILGNVIKLATGGSENGKIQIRISIGSKLTDLNDVNGTTPVTGSLLTYQEGGYFDFTNNINEFVLDSEVSNMISTGISSESSQRVSADESLTNRISSESSTRLLNDNNLSTSISTEVVARTSSDNSLITAISGEINSRISSDVSLSNELSITKSIAKGAQQALSYNDYEYMVLMLKSKLYEELAIGQSIYINTLNVPDLWISNISPVFNPYTYVSDQEIIDNINLTDHLQIGYFYVSFLETSKVDLTDYATTTALSTAISTEESARLEGDSSVLNILNSSISAEASTRISADTSVLNVLNSSISTEASTRVSGDSSLTNAISTANSQRISGDTSLTNRVSNEEVNRVNGDSSLSTKILSEESARVSADVSLSNAIANITVTGELANLSDVDVTTKIDDDLLRFDATTGKWINETPVDILESVNSGELLMNIFGVIQGVTPQNIVADVDTSLTSRISTEESTRLAGDSSLSTSISSEESARISADTSLSVNISTEISDRISGDNSLTSRISSEEVNRVNGDTSLSTSLSITTAIAKGTQQALSFNNYSSMVSYLNGLAEPSDNTTYVGQSIYINTLDVPDVWISANIFPSPLNPPYFYVSDNQLIADVAAGSGYLQMGYYKISFLETQKVDLTNYATNSALSTAISTEASVRSSADSSLTTAISSEASVRSSADSSLSTALTTKIGNNSDTYTGIAAAQYIVTLTQAQYDAIGTKNANTLYVVI